MSYHVPKRIVTKKKINGFDAEIEEFYDYVNVDIYKEGINVKRQWGFPSRLRALDYIDYWCNDKDNIRELNEEFERVKERKKKYGW